MLPPDFTHIHKMTLFISTEDAIKPDMLPLFNEVVKMDNWLAGSFAVFDEIDNKLYFFL